MVDGEQVALGNAAFMAELGRDLNGLDAEQARLSAMGRTPVYVALGGRAVGIVAVADSPRPEAAEVVRSLRRMGLDVVMLTGDNRRTAEAIAAQVGIERVVADVLPGGKSDAIRELQEAGATVAMVGDGINDAPALAQADVGIAIGAGADVAVEAADVTLVRDNLHGIADALDLSRATMRVIRQNLFWAFFYNAALIPIAAGALYPFFGGGVPAALQPLLGEHGFLNPMMAAAAMAVSSFSVVSNSLRLQRYRGKRTR